MSTERRVPVETYSRVVGYFRPVNQWNKGKQSEFEDRNEFKPADVIRQLPYKGGRHDKKPDNK